ncbi:MAG: extracellular solute-binding protein [Defluviitaleaceae bacterium]|nr:extracellular solute-binding protein [Defluviitaleaceae bacterium]MCL2239714.1 extracellular solute-binding protein [Defluviitaleaceae bacterium]
MKKLIALFIFFIALGLGGCGSEDAPAEAPPELAVPPTVIHALPAQGVPQPQPTPEPIRPTGTPIRGFLPHDREEVTVELWHIFAGAQQEALATLIEAFHASQPYVHIRPLRFENYDRLSHQIALGDRAGRLPHLAQASVFNVTRYQAEQVILPFDPFMNDPAVGIPLGEMSSIFDPLRAASQFGGQWFALPFAKSVRVLYYNRELLHAHGLTPPATWEEAAQAARALTFIDEYHALFGLGFENELDAEWISMVRQRGGLYLDEVNGRAHFTTPEALEAMEFIMDTLTAPYARVAGAAETLAEIFARGGVAMFMGSSSYLPHVTEAVAGAFDWGSAPMPGTGPIRATEMTGYSLVMFENMGHSINERVGAWEFLRFVLETENAARWAMSSGFLPMSQAAATYRSFTDFLIVNHRARAAVGSIPQGFFPTRMAAGPHIRAILQEEMADIRDGWVYIEEGLARAELRVNELLAGN